MSLVHIHRLESLQQRVGEELAVSDWVTIDQDRIDQFAQATGDHQWIHVDRERAARGPFGTTIAHGYLTLSLIPHLAEQALCFEDVRMSINYGLNRVRFPSPVGRVKTLHPKVFGGILGRRDLESDVAQLEEYAIPPIDLVIVDLYPFEATVAAGGTESAIIEKIDVGGISLIRAAAKNHTDVVIVPAQQQYAELLHLLKEQDGHTTLAQRKVFATAAFAVARIMIAPSTTGSQAATVIFA